jgi:hypothetical protein
MRQFGIALNNYATARKKLPSGGEGTDWTPGAIGTGFDLHSTFTQLLPYLEETTVADMFDFKYHYDDGAKPQNQAAAKNEVPSFRCPSNQIKMPDPSGYGGVDYMPTVYTDIDPSTGLRNASTATARNSRADGALARFPASVGKITDGTSKTIAIAEDVGRNFETVEPYTKSKYPPDAGYTIADDAKTSSGLRAVNRWAEPDTGNGVSGPPNSVAGAIKGVINNNKTPNNGPADCPWATNNCGPNDEIFSFHPGGAIAVFADGSSQFIQEDIEPVAMRSLVTRAENDISTWTP